MIEVKIEKNGEIVQVDLVGELVLNSAAGVKDEVKGKLAEIEEPKVLINLKELEFVDSSGLGVLISWFRMVNEKKGKIVYCSLGDYVAKIIKIAKLDKILTLAEDEEKGKVLLLK